MAISTIKFLHADQSKLATVYIASIITKRSVTHVDDAVAKVCKHTCTHTQLRTCKC